MGDSDEDEAGLDLDNEEINQGVKKEHILPVIEWLKE